MTDQIYWWLQWFTENLNIELEVKKEIVYTIIADTFYVYVYNSLIMTPLTTQLHDGWSSPITQAKVIEKGGILLLIFNSHV
jgi:hypothetical protein